MKSSDDRPTKQQKRPTHEDIPDVRTRTAVQQAYDNERANPGGWKEWHARTDVKAWHAKPEERARRRRAQAKKTANELREVSPRTCHATRHYDMHNPASIFPTKISSKMNCGATPAAGCVGKDIGIWKLPPRT